MSLIERLADFEGAIGGAASHAPDDYPKSSYRTYESNMADIRELWAEIKPRIRRDLEVASFIEGKLQEAFSAFDQGLKEIGQQAMWDIYNSGVKKLR